LNNTKQAQAMIELFSKQGTSVPITTRMVWEAYKQVKQGGEATGTDGMTWAYLHTHRSGGKAKSIDTSHHIAAKQKGHYG